MHVWNISETILALRISEKIAGTTNAIRNCVSNNDVILRGPTSPPLPWDIQNDIHGWNEVPPCIRDPPLLPLPLLPLFHRRIYDTIKEASHRGREGRKGGSRLASRPTVAKAARKADCLFVGRACAGCRARKQVETNNILAALRERVDVGGGRGEEDGGGTARAGCRRAAVTRRTSAVPSLMPASGPRVPLSLPPSSPPLPFPCTSIRCRLPRFLGDTRRIGNSVPLSYFEGGREGSRVSIAFFNRVETGTGNWRMPDRCWEVGYGVAVTRGEGSVWRGG